MCRKFFDKRCFFCPVADYALLNAHRVLHGADGGGYDWHNMLSLCANCHARIHTGGIVVLGRHFDSLGVRVIHCLVAGRELWLRDGGPPVLAHDAPGVVGPAPPAPTPPAPTPPAP